MYDESPLSLKGGVPQGALWVTPVNPCSTNQTHEPHQAFPASGLNIPDLAYPNKTSALPPPGRDTSFRVASYGGQKYIG